MTLLDAKPRPHLDRLLGALALQMRAAGALAACSDGTVVMARPMHYARFGRFGELLEQSREALSAGPVEGADFVLVPLGTGVVFLDQPRSWTRDGLDRWTWMLAGALREAMDEQPEYTAAPLVRPTMAERKAMFLRFIDECLGNVSMACARAEITRRTGYQWLEDAGHPRARGKR